jgi:hypothetical protein
MQTACAQPARQLRLTTIEAAANAGKVVKGLRFLVISRQDAFVEVYRQIGSLRLPKATPPVIDFERYRVLITFMGQKTTAGYGIRFGEAVVQRGETVEVKVLSSTPPQGAILAQVVTNPYAIAIVEKGRYTTVTFFDESGAVIERVEVK